MNFAITEDRQMLRDAVRDFAVDHIEPHAAQWDEEEELPPVVLEQLGELGLLTMTVAEEDGGSGFDIAAAVGAFEELGARDASTALCVALHTAVAEALVAGSRLDILESALEDGASLGATLRYGDLQATWRAGVVILDGEAGIVAPRDASRFVVCATSRSPAGKASRLVVVPPDADGVSLEPTTGTLGVRAARPASLRLDGVELDARSTLDVEPGYLDARLHLYIAAICVGITRAALEEALSYAEQREQFGRPIADFQAIQFELSDRATALEAARLLTVRAADSLDTGDEVDARRRWRTKAAAFQAAVAAVRGADAAIQIHGGYGYTREYPVERYYRDAQMLRSTVDIDEGRGAGL